MKFSEICLKLFAFPLLLGVPLFALLDLEKSKQNFILETKKIVIEDYPDAFNPSIVRFQGDLLLCFRIRDPLTKLVINQVGFVWLNDDFEPIGDVHLLQIVTDRPFLQDPKLITIGDDLYIIYNNFIDGLSSRRMFYSKLSYDGNSFYAKNPQLILDFEGENSKRHEKNWVPFAYKRRLHLAYSLEPLHILYPLPSTKKCQTISCINAKIDWEWGELRGGTPALIVGDQYLAFFHSSKTLATVQSNGQQMQHYFMGAYSFSKDPPFAINAISPEPIVEKGFYSGPAHNTWKPLRVVFPGGFIFDKNYIWITYGRQDHEIWVAKLDKKALLASLKPISSKNPSQ